MPTPQNGHTQTIRREQPWSCLSVFDNFYGVGARMVKQCRGMFSRTL